MKVIIVLLQKQMVFWYPCPHSAEAAALALRAKVLSVQYTFWSVSEGPHSANSKNMMRPSKIFFHSEGLERN